MKNNSEIMIATSRACLGTPFHHQGRLPHVGLDCIGLVIIALQATGMKIADRTDYGRRPEGTKLVDALHAHGAQIVGDIQSGDILLFRYDGQPQHVAMATSPTTMIHAFAPAGKVVETNIGDYWRRRLTSIYRFSAKQAPPLLQVPLEQVSERLTRCDSPNTGSALCLPPPQRRPEAFVG